jgi:CheY-like chemotaxis protein
VNLLEGTHILIVDDEPELRELLSVEFQLKGCVTQEAANGQEAVRCLDQAAFDVIVSDIRMPNGDGLFVLDSVRRADIPAPSVFLITGYADIGREEAFDRGADGIFAKPFQWDMVVSAVERARAPAPQRWQQVVARSPTVELHRRFASDRLAIAQRDILFGRNGFSVDYLGQEIVQVGDVVAFHVNFDEGELREFRGHGLVQWVRLTDSVGVRRGIGIEILGIAEPDAARFHAWAAAHMDGVATIPKR